MVKAVGLANPEGPTIQPSGIKTPSPRAARPMNQGSSQVSKKTGSSTNNLSSAKLRRKVSVDDTLNNLTSAQRLVEYFLVVSSQPRWESRSPMSATTPPASPESKRKEIRPVSTPTIPEREVVAPTPFSERRKNFGRSLNSIFKRKEKTGTENAIEASLSQEYESESREEPMPPPRLRGKWKRTDSEGNEENIHMPENFEEHSFQPKVTARYPATDHLDNPLNPMVTQFCYPAGEVIVPLREYQMPRLHHFVLTNEKGRKVYGTCLTVYEEYHPPKNTPWKRQEEVHSDSSGFGIEVTVNEQASCVYLPRCLCILSVWPYVTAFREYLAQLYRLATSTNCMNAPIERYVMNLCTEIPAPPPGAFEVQVNILDSVIRFWSPPAKLPIAYVSLPYQTLFDCLDVENILHLWYCLTMERKVLLLSSQYSLLTVCSEILCSLLYPMKWSHLYVPLLPRFLCPMLDAPVPYLCGVTRDNWLHVQQFVSEETIVVDLDRNSVMFGEKTEYLPAVPGKKWSKLQSSLEDIAGHLFWRTRGLEAEYHQFTKHKIKSWGFKRLAKQKGESRWNEKLETYDQAFNLQFTPDSENLQNDTLEHEQNQWDRLQEAFLRFFVAMLKDYRRFLTTPDAESLTSPTVDSSERFKWSKRRSFDRDGFLASQKHDYVPFLSELSMTQQFDDFITKRLYSPEMPDIIFFDQSIDAKLNRSRLKLKKVDTPFLHSAKAHKVLKTFLAVEPNTSELPSDPPFMYKNWPDAFEPTLFCDPRPIPRIITAEFDRQAALVSQLKVHQSPDVDENVELLDFYGSDYDDTPEGMAYTVFFFVYGAVIGREWQEMQLKQGAEETPLTMIDEEHAIIGPNEAVIEGSDSIRDSSSLGHNRALPCSMADGLCGECPTGGNAVDNAVVYVTSTAPCEKYAKEVNSQAHIAYETIASLARSPVNDVRQNNTSLLDSDETFAEYEEAKSVALAQLDLAFDTLKSMEVRGLLADPDVFKSLMQASGRCGDRKRALELIEKMKRHGLVADTSILSCFMEAFAHDISAEYVESSIEGDFIKGRRRSDAYSAFLKRKLEAMTTGSAASTLQTGTMSSSEDESSASELLSDGGSEKSFLSTGSPKGPHAMLEWLTPHKKPRRKHRRKKRTRRKSLLHSTPPVSDRLLKQLILGENLLDFLYPNLVIDTSGDACPQCSEVMAEVDIVLGWLPCEFQDFTTSCRQCKHRFVPKFSVSSSSSTFEGSQGPRTPLFCEFLSPWVLRKELNHIVAGDGGIDLMLDPQWRSGRDINATLWWNLVAMFKRYQLPFSFLLQGSFQNRLISPVPQD